MIVLTGADYAAAAAQAVGQAAHEVLIIMFKWQILPASVYSNVDTFNRTLRGAARRGVFIRAIVNDEATVSFLKSIGAKVKRPFNKKIIHAKLIIADENTALLGSHNLTEPAARANLEISVKFDNPDDVIKLRAEFEKQWQNAF